MILSSQTIATESFEERVLAAAGAGCSGIGLRPKDYARARAAGLSDDDMRALLAEHGLVVAELQALRNWVNGDDGEAEALYAVADALGGRYVIAIAPELPEGHGAAAERLAAVADEAAGHRLTVALEFIPWTGVPDAPSAWELVQAADRTNLGVLVDAWHLFRGSGGLDQLRAIPGERIVAVHLADADADVVGTLLEDTISRRRVPGDGAFPLVDFVRTSTRSGPRPTTRSKCCRTSSARFRRSRPRAGRSTARGA